MLCGHLIIFQDIKLDFFNNTESKNIGDAIALSLLCIISKPTIHGNLQYFLKYLLIKQRITDLVIKLKGLVFLGMVPNSSRILL